MPDHSHQRLVAGLLTALASRTHAEAQQLTAALRERCWPGVEDRTEPVALEWLRLWGPRGTVPLPLACTCRAGRCGVCN